MGLILRPDGKPADGSEDEKVRWAVKGPNGTHIAGDTRPCSHGVRFDPVAAEGLDECEVRRRWPRGWGPCPLGCGFVGIAYASPEHYIAGDW